VVIWDLHESDKRDRGAIFAQLKVKVVGHLFSAPDRAAFIVDEGVTVTEDEVGARTLGYLVRRGRHFGLEVHVPTQRVTRLVPYAHGPHDSKRHGVQVVRSDGTA
jgi:hypothetical protein